MVLGNHTNNYAEAGMRIIKELLFNRIKAYNLVQLFFFVTCREPRTILHKKAVKCGPQQNGQVCFYEVSGHQL